ncbi:hypothetical protein SDJN02_15634, partial [Cucurbita argyrosperma subsp. argyrosperma]
MPDILNKDGLPETSSTRKLILINGNIGPKRTALDVLSPDIYTPIVDVELLDHWNDEHEGRAYPLLQTPLHQLSRHLSSNEGSRSGKNFLEISVPRTFFFLPNYKQSKLNLFLWPLMRGSTRIMLKQDMSCSLTEFLLCPACFLLAPRIILAL